MSENGIETDSERLHRTAVHEAGHAAVALHFGMLGPDGISIIDTDNGETSVNWQITGSDCVMNRATIAMAGVAADAHLRPEWTATEVDWQQAWDKYPPLRIDISKACQLAWIQDNKQMAWDEIAPRLKTRDGTAEDEILSLIVRQQNFRFCWQAGHHYFERAKELLARPQLRCFVQRASERLLVVRRMCRKECLQAWEGCA